MKEQEKLDVALKGITAAINGLKRGRNPHVVKVREELLATLGKVVALDIEDVEFAQQVLSEID